MRILHLFFRLALLIALCLVASALDPAQSPLRTDLNFIGQSFGVPGNASYDYVIVGGGTAGNVVATRLAQSGASVAVVEAGGFYEIDNGNISVVPLTATRFSSPDPKDTNPRIDWGIVTEPQKGMNNRRIRIARGKCLGGSSARNFMFYHHATKDTYAQWARQLGDASYEYNALRKYFRRSAHYTPANNAVRAPNASYNYAGTAFSANGPLQVTLPNYANPVSSYMLKGLSEIGVPPASDFVSGTLSGASYMMQSIDAKDFTRSSSETSYLRLDLEQTGLIIYHNTLAKKILFNGKRASGVLVNTSGLAYTLEAKKEVILSAGAFQSPQLLQVSGVGAREELSRFGIPVVHDLPGVGQNLQDHVFATPIVSVKNVLTHSILPRDPAFLAAAIAEYRSHHTGIVTNSGTEWAGWEKLPKPQRDALSPDVQKALESIPADWPELEFIFFDGSFDPTLLDPATNYVSPVIAIVAPFSRGNVTLASADTADLPVVNPNWLVDKVDQEMMVAGFKRLRELLVTKTLKQIVCAEVFPGLNVTSDAAILEAIKETGMTVYHPACTCKMGKANDPMAVIDSKARVYGLDGLRVVDASAFPLLPPGHPQATIYAFAEKIADDILSGTTSSSETGKLWNQSV